MWVTDRRCGWRKWAELVEEDVEVEDVGDG